MRSASIAIVGAGSVKIFLASEPNINKPAPYRKAMENFERALAINPNHVNAIYNKGYCYAMQGKVALAVNHLQEAIQKNPAQYLPVAKTDPDLDCPHKNKRFQALIGEGNV